jgi:hypothetical protein
MKSNKVINQIQKFGIKLMLQKVSSRLILTAESDSLAKLCELELRHCVVEYPVYSTYEYSPKNTKTNNFLVVIQEPQELDLVLLALATISGKREIKTVVITNIDNGINEDDLRKVIPTIEWEVINRTLTSGEYETLHKRSQTVVLPYSATFYKMGSSGRLLDAFNFGCRIVVPKDLELAAKASQLGICLPYDRGDATSLANALLESLDQNTNELEASKAPTLQNSLQAINELISLAEKMDKKEKIQGMFLGYLIFNSSMKLHWILLRINDFILRSGYQIKLKIKTKSKKINFDRGLF